MRILLINNYQPGNETATYEALKKALVNHDVKIQRYKPGIEFFDGDVDLIILSGGGGNGAEIYDSHQPDRLWYDDLAEFIQATKKPVLGICMGFQVIAYAYGSKIYQMPERIIGLQSISLTKKGKKLFNKTTLMQYQNHLWSVPKVPRRHFDIIARSPHGIEAVKHKTKPILAVQFHPEKGGTIDLAKLLDYNS